VGYFSADRGGQSGGEDGREREIRGREGKEGDRREGKGSG